MKAHRLLGYLIVGFSLTIRPAHADSNDSDLSRLSEMSVEDLINIQVTSVAKSPQNLFKSPAAIFVLTADDIRRSGATSIPELLRLVPGMEVAHINSNTWAVSARGFSDVFANKLLVLVDGRTVYTPLFSGTFWDSQDTMLEDIDRIEVIRGPGATLWGANAVNGVINIITKNAAKTQGSLVTGGGGSEERGFAATRYGGALSDQTHYRVFAKYFNRDNFTQTNGEPAYDAWQTARGGFRLDSNPTAADSFSILADGYYGDAELGYDSPVLSPPFSQSNDVHRPINGADIVGKYSHSFSETSDLSLQSYYDHVRRDDKVLAHSLDTFDLDFQHRFAPLARHEIIWGANYRLYHDDIEDGTGLSFSPNSRDVNIGTWFLQDTVSIVPEELKLTIGSKFEQNPYTNFEYQPNIRATWTPDSENTLWAAVSRAVHTPSRAHVDSRIDRAVVPNADGSETLVSIFGQSDNISEDLIAYEFGYRRQLNHDLSLDIASFFNSYSNLQTLEPGAPFAEVEPSPLHIVQPLFFENRARANTYGGEAVIDWRPAHQWRLITSYSLFKIDFSTEPGSADHNALVEDGVGPEHMVTVRSQYDFADNWEIDATYRFVDSLPTVTGSAPIHIPSYSEVDLRLGWHPVESLEVAVVGQNLLAPSHLEYVSESFVTAESVKAERGVYGKLTWRY